MEVVDKLSATNQIAGIELNISSGEVLISIELRTPFLLQTWRPRLCSATVADCKRGSHVNVCSFGFGDCCAFLW